MTTNNQKRESGREPIIKDFIVGVPYPKVTDYRRKSAKEGEKKWQQEVKDQTAKYEGMVKGPCRLDVVFYLPEDKYGPTNANFGPDLDNLAKPLLDGLKETVLNSVGCDGDACIVSLELAKIKIPLEEKSGARFQIFLTEEHKIEKVETVTGEDLERPWWTEPMQKITTDTGVYLDNMPGVSRSGYESGYDWSKEEGKIVNGIEVYQSRGFLWLKRKS